MGSQAPPQGRFLRAMKSPTMAHPDRGIIGVRGDMAVLPEGAWAVRMVLSALVAAPVAGVMVVAVEVGMAVVQDLTQEAAAVHPCHPILFPG